MSELGSETFPNQLLPGCVFLDLINSQPNSIYFLYFYL